MQARKCELRAHLSTYPRITVEYRSIFIDQLFTVEFRFFNLYYYHHHHHHHNHHYDDIMVNDRFDIEMMMMIFHDEISRSIIKSLGILES
ncbi:hypothetical protein QR98_0076420 [Sarcoptes scabiei]|uniref:Uncharacterized protein n=1 Tax=Sarcoptes scabiei TaxID=52283 RepID=A0A132ADP9_SARSC|nr:hypothetical protein QR98_0076420 [Sarcoptes scabiei]